MPRLTFDFPADAAGPARRVYSDPVEILTAANPHEVVPALRAVEAAVSRGLHAAGYLAYEAAPAFEPRMRVRTGNRLPLLWFGLFAGPVAEPPTEPAPGSAAGAAGGAAAEPAGGAGPTPGGVASEAEDPRWQADVGRQRHAAAVAAIRSTIAEGRTYQVNYTARLRAPFAGDPGLLYDRLRRAQGDGWHALLDLDDHALVSVSPELFFRACDGRIETRPMKGTRPRGRWLEEDEALRRELAGSPKERAENLMIVDLLRNDLGRIARTGSVTVPRLLDVERYRTVWQMTSTVTAELRKGVGLAGIFGALFPCGSVTGAPKISTMEVVAGLELAPREVYCGAIGFVDSRQAVFNVPIRTVWLDRAAGAAEYGAGGGVVWDSSPEDEYDELLAKAAVLTRRWPEFELIETLRLEDGAYRRLARHLDRLASSCAYFGFPDPSPAAERRLSELATCHPVGIHRVRLLAFADGAIVVTSEPLTRPAGPESTTPPAPTAGAPLRRVALAAASVDSGDPFLFHKTTHRAAYDAARAEFPGHFDVLLRNERGELTEVTTGNVVLEIAGRLLTPPRGAGLLAGCFRAELLEAGVVEEAALKVDSLDRASRIWLINSVRGWVEVRLAPTRPGPGTPGGAGCSWR